MAKPTAKHIAAFLGVSVPTVWSWTRNGLIGKRFVGLGEGHRADISVEDIGALFIVALTLRSGFGKARAETNARCYRSAYRKGPGSLKITSIRLPLLGVASEPPHEPDADGFVDSDLCITLPLNTEEHKHTAEINTIPSGGSEGLEIKLCLWVIDQLARAFMQRMENEAGKTAAVVQRGGVHG